LFSAHKGAEQPNPAYAKGLETIPVLVQNLQYFLFCFDGSFHQVLLIRAFLSGHDPRPF